MLEYDVFISCKSEDYSLAEEVYNHLKNNGINVFLSSRELRRLKDADFLEAVSEALDSSYHLLVLSTSEKNVKSKFVKFEWTTFLNEMLSGRKKGQIMTFLIGMKVEELPIQLRHYESFSLEDYKERLLHYVETPAFLQRKAEAALKTELEEKEKQANIESEKRKEAIRREIEAKEADYLRFTNTLEDLSRQIIEKRKELGEANKVCPVCYEVNPIENRFCERCGWTFLPPFDVHPKADKDQLFKVKSIWNELNRHILSNNDKSWELQELTETRNHQGLDNKTADPFCGHEFVDLGLPSRLLWATCNVGAKDNKPEEYGDYFAWGETEPKSSYEWSNLKYCNDDAGDSFSKYNEGRKGTRDRKMQLELSDDAAHVKWGGSWRMPAKEDWEELESNCTWTWTKLGGRKGYKVTGNNGNSIFLPAAGCRNTGDLDDAGERGYYWSSSLHADYSCDAHCCYFNSSYVKPSVWGYRCLGFSVRPVASPSIQ